LFVIALAQHVFSGLKSIKSFGPPTFRFGPPALNACSGAVTAMHGDNQVSAVPEDL